MRLKIAIVRRGSLDLIDGVNRFTFTLASGLKRLGSDVVVVGHHMRDDPRRIFDTDVNVVAIGGQDKGLLKVSLDWFLKGSKLLERMGVDAVIANGAIPLRFKGPKVAVNHGNAIFEYPKEA